MDLKHMIVKITPPVIIDFIVNVRKRNTNMFHDWEYIPQGWQYKNPKIKGWNDVSILNKQKDIWPDFVKITQGPEPLGMPRDSKRVTDIDYILHNTLISYAYALTMASRNKDEISVLDWGGGIGGYYLFSKAILPDVKIDYHCKEMPLLSQYGKTLLPDAHFYDLEEECFKRNYDFVFASSSLHYAEDWKGLLNKLSKASNSYVYITRLPIIHNVDSFVVVQRPYGYGYNTEYMGWFLNRNEFIKYASSINLKLVREFIINERPNVFNAPEQGEYRGFLFKRGDN